MRIGLVFYSACIPFRNLHAQGGFLFSDIPILNQIPAEIQGTIAQIAIIIVIMLILFLARHIIAGIIYRPLKNLFESTDTELDDQILESIRGVTSYLILAAGTLVGTLLLVPVDSDLRAILFRVVLTLLALAGFRVIYGMSSTLTSSPERVRKVARVEVDEAIMPVVRVAAKGLILIAGFLTVVRIWDISVGGILTGIGLGGLAISLAAKELLDDVIGFLSIVGDNIFTKEEYIVSEHVEGIVEKIGLRSTRVRQLNQGLTIVPNSVISNDAVTNWSRLEKRWFNFMVGVTYQATAEQIESFVTETRKMLEGREHVDNDSIVVLFMEYDDSALNILVRCYVDIEDWTASKQERHAVNLGIMQIVDDLGMSIAYPTRSLFVEGMPTVNTNFNGTNGKNGSHEPGEDYVEDHREQASYPGGQDAETVSVTDSNGDGDGDEGE